MRGKKLVLLGVIGLVGVGVAHHYMDRSSEAKSAEPPVVAVAQVTRKDLARQVSFTAELEPFQEIDVHAKVSGYIRDIKVDIGDQVKTGDILATLDVAEQQADLKKAEATFRQTTLDYDRIQSIMRRKPGLLAQDEVDKAKAAYEVAKAERDRAQVFADYSTIVAPFNGIITKRFADKGALIQAGTASNTKPIVHLAENTKLRLVFPVPESLVPLVHTRTKVNVTVQATGQIIESEVARIAGRINDTTRTMGVEVDLDNSDLRLTPGMYASATMALDQQAGVLSVPVQTIAGGDKPTLWVINAQHKIEERSVTVGMQTPTDVEITKGVQEGELVVFGNRTAGPGTMVTPKLVGGSS